LRRRRKRRSNKRSDDDVLGGGGGGREKALKSLHFLILFFVVLVHLLSRRLWREKNFSFCFLGFTHLGLFTLLNPNGLSIVLNMDYF